MRRLAAVSVLMCALAATLSACGAHHIQVSQNQRTLHRGAVLFEQRCGGCHTLSTAGTHGSASNIRTRERNDGPNFNFRCETVDRVLYAIRNGGFSGAIMPQNIVLGADAQAVARFVARYSGQKAKNPPSPQSASNSTASRGSTPSGNAPISRACGTSAAAK